MGGDRGPDVAVEGALLALREDLGPVTLVGDEPALSAALARLAPGPLPAGLSILHAPLAVGMSEAPAKALRTRRQTSMGIGLEAVRAGEAAGFFSAGNSGAVLALATITLRRVPGCERPAIAAVLPSARRPIVLLDAGANAECRPAHLIQFAHMGAAYAGLHLGRTRPTVGLLSNGTEASKGTETLRQVHEALSASALAYAGFIEGRDVPAGLVDVVVTDGFTGNVVLKLSEGIALALVDRIRQTLTRSLTGILGGLLVKGALGDLRRELDWAQVGGAPLLGVEGVAVVGHGASTPRAVASGLRLTRRLATERLPERLAAALATGA